MVGVGTKNNRLGLLGDVSVCLSLSSCLQCVCVCVCLCVCGLVLYAMSAADA